MKNTIKQQTLNAFNKNSLILPLQFFAEGKEVEEKDSETSEDEDVDNSEDEVEEKEEKTLTQSEVNKIIQREKAKAKKEAEKLIKEKLDEVEKLKNMNEKEKSDYEKNKLLEELEVLRTEKTRVGLEKEATSMLAEKKISANETILSFVVGEDADTTKERVESFITTIENIVKEQVKSKLRQDTPPGDNDKSGKKSEIEMLAEKFNNKNKIKENPYF